jgi:hypothetical protein
MTIRTCRLVDHAALASVLNSLYNWSLPLLSVEGLDGQCSGEREALSDRGSIRITVERAPMAAGGGMGVISTTISTNSMAAR